MGFDLERQRKYPASHIGAFTDNQDTWVKVVVDIEGERLKIAKEKFGKQDKKELLAYQVLDNVIDDGVYCDIWVVATPTPTHAEIVDKLVKKMPPRLIFLEKPITDNLYDAEHIVMLCKNCGVKLMVNHTRRFDPFWQSVANIVKEKKYGKLITMIGNHPSPLLRSGIHLIDLMLWYASSTDKLTVPESVLFTGSRENWLINNNPSLNDLSAAGIIRFNTGLIGLINSWTEPDYLLFELDLIFEKGRLRCYDNGTFIQHATPRRSTRYKGLKELLWQPPRIETPNSTAMSLATKNIVDVINNNATPLCTGKDGFNALALIIAAHSSISSEKRIRQADNTIFGQPAYKYTIRSY